MSRVHKDFPSCGKSFFCAPRKRLYVDRNYQAGKPSTGAIREAEKDHRSVPPARGKAAADNFTKYVV